MIIAYEERLVNDRKELQKQVVSCSSQKVHHDSRMEVEVVEKAADVSTDSDELC